MKIKYLIVYGKTKITNASYDPYILLIIILQERKNDNLKYKTISQRKSFNSFSLIYFFFSHRILLYCLYSNSYVQRTSRLKSISYFNTLSFCYVMYYIVSEIYIAGRFLESCFYCYLQQIISVVAKESLNSYNFIQKAPEKQNLSYWNMECHHKSNQTKFKIRLRF